MPKPEIENRIERDTTDLHRKRLICSLIRREGILVQNCRLVIALADSLLDSMSHYDLR
jgi:hypothetical protein